MDLPPEWLGRHCNRRAQMCWHPSSEWRSVSSKRRRDFGEVHCWYRSDHSVKSTKRQRPRKANRGDSVGRGKCSWQTPTNNFLDLDKNLLRKSKDGHRTPWVISRFSTALLVALVPPQFLHREALADNRKSTLGCTFGGTLDAQDPRFSFELHRWRATIE